ncbi:dehydrogenase E1 component [Mycobacterium parascrofulaceum ATCC BAA-614]|uniref:Dehydrogenase E1 component n=1 Tax=Mycobacterium parascrofulaceum ATCC BAA-614 TaxID=525368 RepID=D5PEQ8_9MYCO|nr:MULTISPECIES: thiamine pyrophosphate-dependent enzyme [Mycobacterium]EFG75445.1 dehydrogenase E1 component [Mycobacterium parascrofulaceum ATCC BAA-614]OCB29145.1 dehydrogenase [Mycobacterium malmoense]
MARTPELPAANVGEQLELYRRMWVLRLLDMALEESRIDGLLDGPMVAAFGQEALAVGAVAALRPGDVMSTAIRHFEHARQVGRVLPLGPAIAEMIAPSRAAVADAQESPFATEWKQIFATSDPLRKSILFALGDAYAQRLAGAGGVTLCVVGTDAVDSAEFKSAASIALSWRLPVVFVVENIRDGSGVRRGPRERHGLPVLSADGKDVEAVHDSVTRAVRRASVGEGPTMVEAVTYRTNHPAGVDPLVFARRRLTRAGVSAGHLYEVERRARHLVAEAAAVANALLRSEGPAPVSEPGHPAAAS